MYGARSKCNPGITKILFMQINKVNVCSLFKASTDWLVPFPVPRSTEHWRNHAVGARALHYGTKGEHYNASNYDFIAEYAFPEAKVSILQEKKYVYFQGA